MKDAKVYFVEQRRSLYDPDSYWDAEKNGALPTYMNFLNKFRWILLPTTKELYLESVNITPKLYLDENGRLYNAKADANN